jgi:hypothetical protein
MTGKLSKVGLAVAGSGLAMLAACTASGAGSSPTEGSSSTPPEGRPMSPQVHVSSSASSVVSSDGSGTAVVTVNGRVCHLDVPDAVAVKTVVDNSHAYLEITDKSGKTRRIDCRS